MDNRDIELEKAIEDRDKMEKVLLDILDPVVEIMKRVNDVLGERVQDALKAQKIKDNIKYMSEDKKDIEC